MGSFNSTQKITSERWAAGEYVEIRPLTNGMRRNIVKRITAKENGKPADKWSTDGQVEMQILVVLECTVSWSFEDEDGKVYPIDEATMNNILPASYADFIAEAAMNWGREPEGGTFLS